MSHLCKDIYQVNLEKISILLFVFFRRQCYFSRERELKFFKIYTKANCELECLANLTLRYCNCSLFYTPSEFTVAKSQFKFTIKLKFLRNKRNEIMSTRYSQKLFRICSQAFSKIAPNEIHLRFYFDRRRG
jgi:hypothetical protein